MSPYLAKITLFNEQRLINDHRYMAKDSWEALTTTEHKDAALFALHFIYAARVGSNTEVTRLVDLGMPMDVVNEKGATPVFVAAEFGHLETVRLLTDRGANLNLADKDGTTPVSMAAQNGHHEIVRVLTDKGANLDLAHKNGATPVYVAAEKGYHEIVRVLTDKGANLDLAHQNGSTPVFMAAHHGRHEMVRLLADKGANLNIGNINGFTPVFMAATNGHHEMVRLLADKGADLNLGDVNGCTPLYKAAARGHHEVVRLLANKAGMPRTSGKKPTVAYLKAFIKKNKPPGYRSYSRERRGELMKLATELGYGTVDLELADSEGFNPVFVAAEQGHHEMVRVLADNGANLDLELKNGLKGWTPVYVAAKYGHHEVVGLLTDKGVNLDTRDKLGRTALYMAASKGYDETVRLLVKSGANTDLAGPCMKKTFRYGPQSKPTMEPNPERQCTPLEIATAMGDFKRDYKRDYPYMNDFQLEGYQRVIDLLNVYEKRRIARLGRMVGSVTRQNPRGVKVPQDMNQEIMKFL